MKKKTISVLLLLSIVLSMMFSCVPETEEPNNGETTAAIGDTEAPESGSDTNSISVETTHSNWDRYNHNGYNDEFTMVRDTWNIELKYVEYTERLFLEKSEKVFIIDIYDYDNVGFCYDDGFYDLEYLENGEWTYIVDMNDNIAMNPVDLMLVYIYPREENEFIHIKNTIFLLGDIPSRLKSGHYRLSQIFSDHKFSVEFDLVIEE